MFSCKRGAQESHHTDTHLQPQLPSKLWEVVGYAFYPNSSLSLSKEGGLVQVGLDRAKSSGGQHEDEEHMNM